MPKKVLFLGTIVLLINIISFELICSPTVFASTASRELSCTSAPPPGQPDNPDGPGAWYTAGANRERTSWSTEEVRGNLNPVWYKKFAAYIPHRVQIIAVDNVLYVATSRGLYALNAENGSELWTFPTEQPLGHSPTVVDEVVYVGGLDHRLYALNAHNGQVIWTYTTDSGFHTNPLVVNNMVYAGNRNGYFYAVHATGPNAGQLAWRFKTEGPILYSAAYKDGTIYFASNDSHAYALNADNGTLIWKSEKLPGAGFYSWWPVVWRDRIILSGSNNYRVSTRPGPGSKLTKIELTELYPGYDQPPFFETIGEVGNQPGDWASGSVTINVQDIIDYFQEKPWRRTVFVLDRFTGEEREIAPILWTGTHSGTRYPPVVGSDEVLYQQSNYISSPTIAGGGIAGWQPGVDYINIVSSDWGAVDEPHAVSAGGNVVYWNLCCDRQAGSFDITMPNTVFQDRYDQNIRPPTGGMDNDREWLYFNYNLYQDVPDYNSFYYNPDENYTHTYASFGGPNGVYGFHGEVNPPVPHNGRVYMHRSNAVFAFGEYNGDPVELPTAEIESVNKSIDVDPAYLQNQLETEIQKILDAGHLRPGYMSHGILDLFGRSECADNLVDYWHQPSEIIVTLLQALPHLPDTMQVQVRNYMQEEFETYPPYEINHLGWQEGAAREFFDLPPEAVDDLVNLPPTTKNLGFEGWNLNPYAFYAAWKYAEEFGDARNIFDSSAQNLETPPSDAVLQQIPFAHNAFIAGYYGYLELERLAGYAESPDVRLELNRLLELRATTFTAESSYGSELSYCRSLNVATNFMYLTPELANYLQNHAFNQVQAAMREYEYLSPYWFVSFSTEGFAENVVNPLYDSHSIFMAKALIFNESAGQLREYLDVPVFKVGDLYYLQKLAILIDRLDMVYHYLPAVAAEH